MREYFGDLSAFDSKSLDVLFKMLSENNLEGFDYLEFKKAVYLLGRKEGLTMDKTAAFQSAFTTATTIGLTKEKLVNSARHYIGLIKKEEEKLNSAAEEKRKQQSILRNGKKEQLQKEIGELENIIVQLEERLIQKRRDLEQKQRELSVEKEKMKEEDEKIKRAKDNFAQASRKLVELIKLDLKQIEAIF